MRRINNIFGENTAQVLTIREDGGIKVTQIHKEQLKESSMREPLKSNNIFSNLIRGLKKSKLLDKIPK